MLDKVGGPAPRARRNAGLGASRSCSRSSTCPSTTPPGTRSIRPSAGGARSSSCGACFLRESQAQPLCLVIEDLHWIDSEAQSLLDGWSRACPPRGSSAWSARGRSSSTTGANKSYYAQISLEPLAARARPGAAGYAAGRRPRARRAQGAAHRADGGQSVLPGGERLASRGDGRARRRARRVPPRPADPRVAGTGDRPGGPGRAHRPAPRAGEAAPAGRGGDRQGRARCRCSPRSATSGRSRAAARTAHLQAAELLYEVPLFPASEYTFKHALTFDVACGQPAPGAPPRPRRAHRGRRSRRRAPIRSRIRSSGSRTTPSAAGSGTRR